MNCWDVSELNGLFCLFLKNVFRKNYKPNFTCLRNFLFGFQVQQKFELLSFTFNIEDLRGRSIIAFEQKKNDFVTAKLELKIVLHILRT